VVPICHNLERQAADAVTRKGRALGRLETFIVQCSIILSYSDSRRHDSPAGPEGVSSGENQANCGDNAAGEQRGKKRPQIFCHVFCW